MKAVKIMRKYIYRAGLLTLLILFSFNSIVICRAESDEETSAKEAVIKLSFDQNDSERICKATVTAADAPVKGTEVHFYVKRMYSLLPIDKAVETDTAGNATVLFPKDLPGDKNGNLSVIAKIEDDDNYGNVETESAVKWGTLPAENELWGKRSLSASRDKAPMILILVSNTIIALIWGTIVYVIYQIFRIKKESTIIKIKKK